MPSTTMKRIAADLGVSMTTVSKGLNHHDDISSATRARVRRRSRRWGIGPTRSRAPLPCAAPTAPTDGRRGLCRERPGGDRRDEGHLDAGLEISDDIAVVRVGDIALGDLLRVPLTTVSWSRMELGRQAADLLLSSTEGQNGDR